MTKGEAAAAVGWTSPSTLEIVIFCMCYLDDIQYVW
jgi:hypothetical protein